MRGCRPRYKIGKFVRVDGDRSGNISIMNNDLRSAASIVERAKDTIENVVYVGNNRPQ